jgi:predicted SAM-dependent methyltransferase
MKLKLNLGCGPDIRQGYVNVDLEPASQVLGVDLSQFPWPWEDDSTDEILMLDLLEHFPYRQTDSILNEAWRVLKVGGHIDIQVPDFEHCAFAAMDMDNYLCNVCGKAGKQAELSDIGRRCSECKTPIYDIAEAAIRRLYGGQDVKGNWHFNAFTKESLVFKLKRTGFKKFEFLEKHHQWKNWNFKIRAVKDADAW